MLLTARQIITCLVAASAVSGLDHRLPLHDEIELVHEPVLSPNFNIYDSPLEMVHGVSRKRSEDMSLQDKADIALAYLGDKHGIARDTVRITDAYTSEATGLTHIYARQTVGGIDLVNGVANINIDKRGRVISSSQSFVPVRRVRRALRSGHLTARMDQDASLKAAFKALNKRVGPRLQDEEHEKIRVSKAASDGPVNTASGFIIEGIPHTASVDGKAAAEQSIMQRADGSLVHVWDITLEQDDHWWNARMNAATGEVESLHDWVLRYRNTDQLDGSIRENGDGDNESTSISAGDFQEGLQKRATYRAIPINRLDPTAGFVNIANPEDTSASPVGWLSDGVNTYTGTLGNNVIAFRGETDDTTRQTSPNQFVYNWNPSTSPTTGSNIDVSRTTVFYVVNTLHDVFYRYGFTERAFNFQKNNFNKGGVQNDQVFARVQDSEPASKDFGSFTTPPEGQAPRLQTFLNNATNPPRDAALSVDIVSGLYTLGVASRMVGGGTARCLNTLESAGLQRGYADAVADWQAQNSAQLPDFRVGTWLTNNPRGIRHYPYSTNPQTNPLRYSNIFRMQEPADIGEVWANVLHNALATFTAQFGWSPNARTNPNGGEGNIRFLHLLVDSLALIPCNPTFLQARNGFIQADNNRYRGAHTCLLWRVFASRGFGYSARPGVDGFDVPQGC